MKAVLMSIKPKWCEKIFNGEKTVEVRKSAPKLKPPFKVYVYCTKSGMRFYGNKNYYVTDMLKLLNGSAIKAFENSSGFYSWNGKVIGEFVCDKVRAYIPFGLRGFELFPEWLKEMCLSKEQLDKYGGLKTLYGWHITEPKLFDKPRALSEFGNYKTEWVEWYHSDDKVFCPLTRPPQSWQYVEELQ